MYDFCSNPTQASNIAGLVRGMSSNTLNTPKKYGKSNRSIPPSHQQGSRGPSEVRNSVYSENLVSERANDDLDEEETTSFGFRPTKPAAKETKKSGRVFSRSININTLIFLNILQQPPNKT